MMSWPPAASRSVLSRRSRQLGAGLFGSLLADMAGIEDDHVGGLGAIGRDIAQRRQDIRHPAGVVDIHLAAVGFDIELLRQGLTKTYGCQMNVYDSGRMADVLAPL